MTGPPPPVLAPYPGTEDTRSYCSCGYTVTGTTDLKTGRKMILQPDLLTQALIAETHSGWKKEGKPYKKISKMFQGADSIKVGNETGS